MIRKFRATILSTRRKKEKEEVKSVVDPFPLLELSPKVQLNIFSFLLDNDLDSLSNSCGRFRNIVHKHRRKLYRRTILCSLYCGTGHAIVVNLDCQKSFGAHCSNIDGVHPALTSISVYVTDEKRQQILEDTFLGLSTEQFFDKITQRKAGIILRLNNLEYPHLEILQHALKHTVRLDITCRVNSLSREMQFRHLFAPRHSLKMDDAALVSEPCIVDDQFCRVAGYGELKLLGCQLGLTEDHLLMLVNRTDLKKLRIHLVESMSYESIRSAAQVLLEEKKECYITFQLESLEFRDPLLHSQFSRKIGHERIEITQTSNFTSLYGDRNEKQYHYTNKERTVKICVVRKQRCRFGRSYDYEIVLHSNSVDPEKSY